MLSRARTTTRPASPLSSPWPEACAATPPRHPVVLAVFDGEELGLRGARAFVAAPPAGTPPLGMDLNLDML